MGKLTNVDEISGSQEKLMPISPRILPTLEGLFPPRNTDTPALYIYEKYGSQGLVNYRETN